MIAALVIAMGIATLFTLAICRVSAEADRQAEQANHRWMEGRYRIENSKPTSSAPTALHG